jgi:hypothetical protein
MTSSGILAQQYHFGSSSKSRMGTLAAAGSRQQQQQQQQQQHFKNCREAATAFHARNST